MTFKKDFQHGSFKGCLHDPALPKRDVRRVDLFVYKPSIYFDTSKSSHLPSNPSKQGSCEQPLKKTWYFYYDLILFGPFVVQSSRIFSPMTRPSPPWLTNSTFIKTSTHSSAPSLCCLDNHRCRLLYYNCCIRVVHVAWLLLDGKWGVGTWRGVATPTWLWRRVGTPTWLWKGEDTSTWLWREVQATLTWLSLEFGVSRWGHWSNLIVRLGIRGSRTHVNLLLVRSLIVHLETAGSIAEVRNLLYTRKNPTSRQY
jgi:hypothetical protein